MLSAAGLSPGVCLFRLVQDGKVQKVLSDGCQAHHTSVLALQRTDVRPVLRPFSLQFHDCHRVTDDDGPPKNRY